MEENKYASPEPVAGEEMSEYQTLERLRGRGREVLSLARGMSLVAAGWVVLVAFWASQIFWTPKEQDFYKTAFDVVFCLVFFGVQLAGLVGCLRGAGIVRGGKKLVAASSLCFLGVGGLMLPGIVVVGSDTEMLTFGMLLAVAVCFWLWQTFLIRLTHAVGGRWMTVVAWLMMTVFTAGVLATAFIIFGLYLYLGSITELTPIQQFFADGERYAIPVAGISQLAYAVLYFILMVTLLARLWWLTRNLKRERNHE